MKVNRRVAVVFTATTLLLSLTTLAVKLFKTKRARRFAVRPVNRKRNKEGAFATLVKQMNTSELDSEQFFKYVRMTPRIFDHLLSLIGPRITRSESKHSLSPEHRLVMTLHYLSEGCSMQEIAWNFRVGKSTVHYVIKETCTVLWDVLMPLQLPQPTTRQWEKVSIEFYKKWNVPNCIGAVDGKHILIQAPFHSGSNYFNYKKSFSLVLMATCDAYYRFTLIDIGAEGSNHDSAVFKASGFGNALLTNNLQIPKKKCLPYTEVELPHFFVADSAFPLHLNIMRPYPGNNLGEEKLIFNYRISRARRTIENAFGILVQRWRIFRKPIVASIDICELIIQATVVLHNFLQNSEKDFDIKERKYCPTGQADYLDENGDLHPGTWQEKGFNLRSVRRVGTNNYSRNIAENRDQLARYFVCPVGSLPWQENYILRGSVPTSFVV